MVWSARLKGSLGLAAESAAALAGGVAAVATDGPAAVAALIAAGAVVTHLVASSRSRAGRSTLAAADAAARAAEAKLLAETSASLLAEPAGPVITPRIERALGEAGARIQLCHAPAPRAGESAVPLHIAGRSGWLYLDRTGPWTRADADRIQRGLSELIELAQQRAVVANATAESEAERRAEAARSTILDAVSHDMRGPITAIQTATGALQDDALPEPIRTELASAIATEADRLGRMVADLDDLATVESGAVRTDAGWCDLREIIARAIGTVRERRGEFPIRTDLAEDLSPVHADPRQMERVFTNLIENAAKFAPADTPVEVRGIRANGRVTIRVVDKGRGIPASQHSQVFKPFVRGRDAEPGAGLGLAICRGFVEANGGRITLQSRGREGAAFAVSFPAAPQPSVVG